MYLFTMQVIYEFENYRIKLYMPFFKYFICMYQTVNNICTNIFLLPRKNLKIVYVQAPFINNISKC